MNKFLKPNGPIALLLQFMQNPAKFAPIIDRKHINKHIFAYVFMGITFSAVTNTILSLIFTKQYESLTGVFENTQNLSIIFFAFLLLIIAPLFEELIFRGTLAKGSFVVKRIWLFIVIYIFAALSFLFFTSRYLLLGSSNFNYSLFYFICTFFLSILIASVFPIKLLFKNIVFNSIMYFQAILFGLVHISNYSFNSPYLYLLIPFLISNQIYLGFVNGYLSSKYVITKAIFAHFLNNLIAFCAIVATYPNMDSKIVYLFIAIGIIIYTTGLYYFITLNFNFTKNNSNQTNLTLNV